MKAVISVALFLFAVYVIVFGFGNAARSVAGVEIENRSFSTPYLEGITALRSEMAPYEATLLVACLGFLALGVSRNR